MKRLQKAFITVLAIGIIALLWSRPSQALIQSQRAQIGVTIIVNVTPSPIAYAPQTIAQAPIVAKFAMHARGSSDAVDATISDVQTLVAQASAQNALKVQANVTPNPNATLLTANYPGTTISGVAGSTVKVACVYQVKVQTTQASWTLRQGLSSHFDGTVFPGTDLSNNSYLSPSGTPNPTYTPFVVYPSAWTVLASGGATRTYCVDLQVAIPGNTPQGSYSSNAIYTLYY